MDLPPSPPAEALAALLPSDVAPAILPGAAGTARLRHEAARRVWHGVVWSRLGRADLAYAQWDRVHLPTLQPWIAAERGRVLREFGLHVRAEALEWPALLDADDPVDAAMLRISLAADAVGLGDLVRARRRLAAAEAAVEVLPDGPRAARQRLRLAWVRVEVAALGGAPLPTAGLPVWDAASGRSRHPADAAHGSGGRPHHPAEAAHGSQFHRAKGLLFGGIAHGDPRLLDAAADLAPPMIAWAVHLARADVAGRRDAEAAARDAWAAVVPPPGLADEVAATPAARRLTARA